jgi:hypothetical protein
MLVALGPGFAGAATTTPPTGPGEKDVIQMKIVKGKLKFVGPQTVHAGDELEVANKTNPKQVGPHTFSLVTQGSLPKTPKARQNCFAPKHICRAIAQWHGVKGEGPVTKNPALAGPEGWSTMGTPTKKGDSWFTGNKPNTSFVQKVTVDVSAGPQPIYFLCAIHPEMQGTTTVLPAG